MISAIDLLISKYLSGNTTIEENTELLHWMEVSEENRIYFSRQKAIWLFSENEEQAHHEEKWEQLKYKLQNSPSAIHHIRDYKPVHFRAYSVVNLMNSFFYPA